METGPENMEKCAFLGEAAERVARMRGCVSVGAKGHLHIFRRLSGGFENSRRECRGDDSGIRQAEGGGRLKLGWEWKVNAGEILLRVTPQSCSLIRLHYSFRERSFLTLQFLLRQHSASAERGSDSFLISADCSQRYN